MPYANHDALRTIISDENSIGVCLLLAFIRLLELELVAIDPSERARWYWSTACGQALGRN